MSTSKKCSHPAKDTCQGTVSMSGTIQMKERQRTVSGILMTFHRSIPRPAKSTTTGAPLLHEGGRAGHAPRDLLLRCSAAGAESARWLGPVLGRCGVFSPALLPDSPWSYVWAIGPGCRARSSAPPPPQPLSLTFHPIYPLCRNKPSSSGRCLQDGGVQYSSPCGHGHH